MSEEIQEEPGKYVAVDDEGTIKVDLRVSPDEVQPESTEEEAVSDTVVDEGSREEEGLQLQEEEVEEESLLQEITEEEEATKPEATEEYEEAVAEAEEKGIELPENIQKLVEFMNDTGGSLEDYVRLNSDYSKLSEDQILREYYETVYTHYDKEDIDFLLSDKFSYDEDLDDEREIRMKKLERKEALAKAKTHLDSLKDKYYDDIKMGSKLNPEQQKAVEFFNRYKKESEEAAKVADKRTSKFLTESEKVFSDGFEGFDYNVGDKKYRFKVKNPSEVKQTQSDINNFVKKFLNENNEISDAKGYHKSLFTAMNADQIAQHFYEQGKADATKTSMAKTKNVDMDPRGVHEKVTTPNGWTIRAVDDGQSSSKLKVRFKK